jgi:hypothetical protein
MRTRIDKLEEKLEEKLETHEIILRRTVGSRWLWMQWLPGTLLGLAALAAALLW